MIRLGAKVFQKNPDQDFVTDNTFKAYYFVYLLLHQDQNCLESALD
jgi:hypothetical protein